MTMHELDAISIQRLHDLAKLAATPDRILSWDALCAASEGFDPKDARTRKQSIIPLDQTIVLPPLLTVSLTLEQQSVGLSRHVSISRPVRMAITSMPAIEIPSVPTIEIIATELGIDFVTPQKRFTDVWLEKYGSGRYAVNIIQSVDLRRS